MQNHPAPSHRTRRRLTTAAFAGLLLAARLAAQTAPTPVAPRPANVPAPSTDELITLSPFQVAADTDRGYQALNTLSGTRLNSKLEDLGSSITVITKQQMFDTASLDLNDLFLYEASTEGTGNYTQFTPNRNGGVIDGVANDPATANRIRGVGSPISGSGVNMAIGSFTTNSRIPMDPYNIDSVEISRGPNSNLFGLGAATGTVNLVQSKANLTRALSSASVRFDSEGGHRVSLDVSRPLIKDKLALRFAAVDEDKAYTRKPSGEDIRRYFGAIQARPFRNTTINASFEKYDNSYRRPNSLTPRDTTFEWNAGGRPIWDPTTQRVTLANGTVSGPYAVANENTLLPIGLMAGSGYGRTVAWVDPSGVQFFTVGRTANPITTGTPSPYTNNSNVRYLQTGTDILRRKANPYPLFFAPATNNKSLYDWSSINFTAANYGEDTANTFRLEGEQVIFNNATHLIATRAGYMLQKFERTSFGYIDNTDTIIYLDINSKLLDGRPNPNLLRPYVEAIGPFSNRNPDKRDIVNGDIAYQLTPSKELPRWLSWIGVQRFNAHLERSVQDTENYTYGQWIADDHAWTNRANRVAVNQLNQRYYLGDNQGLNIDYGPATLANINGTHNLTWFNNLTGQWVNEPTRVDLLARPTTTRARNELRTVSLTSQNYFFKDRLVTTVGWRRDRRRERTSGQAAVDPATGLVNYNNYAIWGAWTDDATGPLGEATRASQRGDTKTYGAVVKPFSWLNLHYNRSDSFFPQVVRYAMDLKGVIPNAKGEGKDYGLSFVALQGKLSVKLNRYEVLESGSRAGEIGTIGNRTFRLEGRPENNGIRDANGFYPWALALSNSRFAAQGITPTAQQSAQATARIMGVTDDWMTTFLAAGPGQPQTNGLSDVVSKGYELEVTYNPTRNWRIKFTGAQQVAIDAKIGSEQFDYWQTRLPVWTTARADSVPGNGDGRGAPYWTTVPALGGDTPETAYFNGLLSPYLFGVANVGKPRTQVRKYRWASVTNYSFTEGRLKNFNVGGSVRWEDKGSIGFFGAAPSRNPGSFNGVILELDPNRPIYDKSRFYFDASIGYRFRFFGDKVRTHVQLNVKNVFEDGRLQPVGANPDGSTYAYRIIEPRRFVLSASFDL